jgi:hypothetical protein
VNAVGVGEALARVPEERWAYWRRLVHTPLSERELADVRRSVMSGRPFGAAARGDHGDGPDFGAGAQPASK